MPWMVANTETTAQVQRLVLCLIYGMLSHEWGKSTTPLSSTRGPFWKRKQKVLWAKGQGEVEQNIIF